MTPDVASLLMSGLAPASALVFARVAGLCWTAPALATSGLDAKLRVALAVLLAAVLAPVVAPGVAAPGSLAAWASTLAAEAVVGAALGWSAALVVAAARQAGELVGMQAGLSAAGLFDPEAGDELTPLGHLYGWLALCAFLALDGPLVLVRALVESYQVVPPGATLLAAGPVNLAFGRVGDALVLALQIAAPAALALVLAGLALGLLGRAAPSLQLLALAIPVRVALGVLLVLAGAASLGAALGAAWGRWPTG